MAEFRKLTFEWLHKNHTVKRGIRVRILTLLWERPELITFYNLHLLNIVTVSVSLFDDIERHTISTYDICREVS